MTYEEVLELEEEDCLNSIFILDLISLCDQASILIELHDDVEKVFKRDKDLKLFSNFEKIVIFEAFDKKLTKLLN